MNDQKSSYSRSYLFTVRLWSENMGSAGMELRGEVRHVQSRELRYFREWESLITYLADKVHESVQEGRGDGVDMVSDVLAGGES